MHLVKHGHLITSKQNKTHFHVGECGSKVGGLKSIDIHTEEFWWGLKVVLWAAACQCSLRAKPSIPELAFNFPGVLRFLGI